MLQDNGGGGQESCQSAPRRPKALATQRPSGRRLTEWTLRTGTKRQRVRAGLAKPHSKTLRAIGGRIFFRQVLECGCPLPLLFPSPVRSHAVPAKPAGRSRSDLSKIGRYAIAR